MIGLKIKFSEIIEMKRFTTYINKLINVTVKTRLGFTFTMSGYVTAVGKEHILILDSDENEHSYKKSQVTEITCIRKKI